MSGMPPDAGSPGVVDPGTELLREAARLAHEWSPTLCAHGGDDAGAGCADYHGAWPTLRLLGTITGARTDEAFFLSAFEALGRELPRPRVLLAGCADHAMLELLRQGCARVGARPHVTVVDRCATPLALNRWYAQRLGIQVEVVRADVLAFESDTGFDLATTHSILSFVPADDHATLFGRWHGLLHPGGRLVLAQGVRPGHRGPLLHRFSEAQVEHFVQRVLADFQRHEGPLHLDEPGLRDLALRFARHKTLLILTEAQRIREQLERSGFRLLHADEVDRAGLAWKSSNAEAREAATSARFVAVAA